YRKRALAKLVGRLSDHLAMVYQRFLDGNDDRERTVKITVNEKELQAWDPFLAKVTKAPVAEKDVPVKLADGKSASFLVRAFILPRKEEYQDSEAREEPRISN